MVTCLKQGTVIEYSALGIPVILDRIPQISKSVPLAVSIGTYRCSI